MSIGHRSLHDNIDPKVTLQPAAYTAGGNGTAVPLAGSQAWVFEITLGTWTDGTHTIHFEYTTDGTAWSAIDAEDLDGYDINGSQVLASGGQTFVISSNANVGKVYTIGYIGHALQLRARNAASGTTDGAIFGVSVIKGDLRYRGRNPMTSDWGLDNQDPEA